jgi:hypothetical protein
MRIKTAIQMRKEITALDLAVKMLRAETEGLRRSTVTLKKATNAPLALWESHWFDALPAYEQELINKSARMIGNALKPQPPTVSNYTSTTPIITSAKPIRSKSTATNSVARWTKTDDRALLKMKKQRMDNTQIAQALGRSESSVKQRYTRLKAQ